MGKWAEKCKKGLAFLLTALLLYGGVKDVMMAAAEADSAGEQTTVSGGDAGADTVLGGEPGDPGTIPGSEAGLEDPALVPGNGVGLGNSGVEAGETISEVYVPDADLPDNDVLFAGYVEQLLYGGADWGISLYGNAGGDRLTGDEKTIYDALKTAIQDIAAGTRTSTEITVGGLSGNLTGDSTKKILNYLLMDCPYDFYWYDKVAGVLSGPRGDDTYSFSFSVAQEYRASDAYSVDSSKVEAAKTAAAKAREIVDKYAGMSDYDKLVAYRQEICTLTAYNTGAAADSSMAYGNPWQLIWVFDGDSSTNVVCEGYSKAFQYLCDLSTFSGDTRCYTVTGIMGGGTGAGDHMWNIVTIGGRNYLVDVTNCDDGTVGAPDQLFLAGTAGSAASEYTFSLAGGGIIYKYGDDQEGLLGSVLTLAGENYQPEATLPAITVTAGTYQISKVYDGTTDPGTASGELAVSGILAGDTSVSVTAAPVAYTSPNVGGQAQITIPLTLSGAGADNYVLATTSVTVPCTITPKPITPTVEITGTYAYTGSAVIPVLTVKNGSQVLMAAEYEVTLSNNVNAGTARAAVDPKAGGNYTWSTVTGSFVIGKADYSGERTASTAVKYGRTGILDLASLLPEGYQLGTVAVTDNEGILAEPPVLSGTQLSCRMVDDRAKTGSAAVITVPVTETLNYNGFDLTVTVVMSDRLEQTGFGFQETAINKVYGDADFTAAVVNTAPGSSLTFASSDPAVATVDNTGKVHILKAGSTVLTVNASETEEYMAASASCVLTASPKALSWDVSGLSAVDRDGTVQNRTASLYGELRVAGILEADRAEAVYNCPADLLTGVYTAVAPGTQTVVLAWKDAGNRAVLQGAKAENYAMPSTLPAIAGRINAVSGEVAPIPESTASLKFSITMEDGLSQVPEAFKELEELNTPVKLETQMVQYVKDRMTDIPRENITVYDISLVVSINGGVLQPATKDDFPAGGLTVTLPYPAGTGKDSHDFVVCHLFTEDMNGHRAGETEYPEVTRTAEGIRFKVYGLSPVSVAWKPVEISEDTGDDGEEAVVSTPAAASGIKSPKTGEFGEEADRNVSASVSGTEDTRTVSSVIRISAAVLLWAGPAAAMWRKRRRMDSLYGRRQDFK